MVRKVKNSKRIVAGIVIWALIFVTAFGLAWSFPGFEWSETQQQIKVWHDRERQVTCWIYFDQAISCLPDRVVKWEEEEKK